MVTGLLIAAIVMRRFPWRASGSALVGADPLLLFAGLAVNLVSLLAKGWEWRLLLRPVAECRWRTAQEANLAGAAANSISVSVVGEAVRLDHLVAHDRVEVSIALASIVLARAVEGVALALFLVAAPFALDLPESLRRVRWARSWCCCWR